jgi:hypothetical protein
MAQKNQEPLFFSLTLRGINGSHGGPLFSIKHDGGMDQSRRCSFFFTVSNIGSEGWLALVMATVSFSPGEHE